MTGPIPFALYKDLRDHYPTVWALAGEIFTLLVSLTIYRLTSNAFAPTFAGTPGGYFDFLLLGELTLFVPLSVFHGAAAAVRTALADGTLDAMLAQPVRRQTIVLLPIAALFARSTLRTLATFFVAAILFGFHLSGRQLVGALALQVLALPAFVGLGLASAALVVRFGRGDTALNHLGAIAALLAGAYFPLSVLPASIQKFSHLFSPFTVLMESTRHGLTVHDGLALVLWGILTTSAGYLALGRSFESLRRSGRPLPVAV